MYRLSAVKNLDAAEAVALTTHRGSVGTDHANVVTNTADIAGGKGPGHNLTFQAGATADATIASFIAGGAGSILTVYAKLGTACGGAETVDVDVQIGAVSCLTGVIALTAASGTNVVAGVIDIAANALVAGDVVSVVINQTTGGADTAANLIVDVGWRNT